MSAPLVSLQEVQAASARIGDAIPKTAMLMSETLSQLTGAEIWLKFENLQFTGSFKQRGALNTLLSLSQEERARGVIAVSAGNHAQGVAYHAAKLGIRATIVMPCGTPTVKASRTRALGAEVVLEGADFAEATSVLHRLAKQRQSTIVHPFEDDRIIAGQGTVGLEMLASKPDLDAIVVPVGGGGLLAGIGVVARALALPVELLGVQTTLYPAMAAAMNHMGDLPPPRPTIAEGIAVPCPGARTRAHVLSHASEILLVNEHQIETALALLLQIEKTLSRGLALQVWLRCSHIPNDSETAR